MRYLLDTDFVIDHLTGQQDARDRLVQLLPQGVAISIITFSEIYEGIYGSRDPRAAARAFTTFLSGVPVLLISRSVAKRTARLRLELRGQGRPITHRALDLLIAATALVHNLVLVTRNSKDYADVSELGESTDPEALRALLARYYHRMKGIIYQQHAAVGATSIQSQKSPSNPGRFRLNWALKSERDGVARHDHRTQCSRRSRSDSA